MKWCHRIVALLLAALWLPALAHCDLDTGGTHADAASCCSHESGSVDAGCVDDHCDVFHQGQFRAGEGQTRLDGPAAPMLAEVGDPGSAHAPTDPVALCCDCRAAAPPAGRSWIFVQRAASWANAPC